MHKLLVPRVLLISPLLSSTAQLAFGLRGLSRKKLLSLAKSFNAQLPASLPALPPAAADGALDESVQQGPIVVRGSAAAAAPTSSTSSTAHDGAAASTSKAANSNGPSSGAGALTLDAKAAAAHYSAARSGTANDAHLFVSFQTALLTQNLVCVCAQLSSSLFSLAHICSCTLVIVCVQTKQLWSWLPDRFQVMQPELLYTSDEHGTNMDTLFSMAQEHEPTILLVKTTRTAATATHIIGALCALNHLLSLRSRTNMSA